MKSLTALAILVSAAACASGSTWRATAVSEARRAIATEAALDPRSYPVRALAVLPLAPPANDTIAAPLGFALAELIAIDLARTGRLLIVDRTRTEALLRELSLAASGRVDSATAPRTGKLLGARRVTTGTITGSGNNYQIQMRVVDVATGAIVPVSSIPLNLDRVFEAEQTSVLRLLDALGVQITPSERDALSRNATAWPRLPAMLAFGRGGLASAAGDLKGAERQFKEAAKLDPNFAQARERLKDLQNDPTSFSASPIKRVVQGVGDQVVRAAPVRTAEAADAPASSTQRLVTLIIQLGAP